MNEKLGGQASVKTRGSQGGTLARNYACRTFALVVRTMPGSLQKREQVLAEQMPT